MNAGPLPLRPDDVHHLIVHHHSAPHRIEDALHQGDVLLRGCRSWGNASRAGEDQGWRVGHYAHHPTAVTQGTLQRL